MGHWLSSASWSLTQVCSGNSTAVLQNCKVSIPMCSTRNKATCVPGLSEQSGLLSTHRLDWTYTTKPRAHRELFSISQDVVPGQDLRRSAPHLEQALSWALPVPSAQSHTIKSFSWGTYVQLIPQHSSKCRLWESQKASILAKHAVGNSILSRNMAHYFKKQIWGRYQTDKYCHLGWLQSSLGHHLSTETVPQNLVQHWRIGTLTTGDHCLLTY